MALWNDLSRKASDTKAKAIQQARTLTEAARLTGVISDEKKKIDDYYYALGRSYAEAHREDYEAAFAQLMNAIAESERIIEESQEQLREIKGVQCCANCGTELPKNSAFCSTCGAAIPKPKAPEGPVCGNCGTVLAEGMRFCSTCGTPVAQKAEAPAVNLEKPSAPQQKNCPQCGAEQDGTSAFCMICGHKLG